MHMHSHMQVLHNASQEEVYDSCVQEITSRLMDGYNGTLMAYGETGAGKTYTMTGATDNYPLRGIIPRAISQVCACCQSAFEKMTWYCILGIDVSVYSCVSISMQVFQEVRERSEASISVRLVHVSHALYATIPYHLLPPFPSLLSRLHSLTSISYLEIYNEVMHDLLSTLPESPSTKAPSSPPHTLTITEVNIHVQW